MSVGIVVDSTAGIPSAVAHGQGITVVPVNVVLDGRPIPEPEVDVPSLMAGLRHGTAVQTTSPGVEAFVATYRELAAAGAREIVSVHLPSSLSYTLDDAREAASVLARDGGPVVHLVDGQVTGMGLGWVALAAAGASASGMSGEQVRDVANRVASRTLLLFAVGDVARLQATGKVAVRRSLMGSGVGSHPVVRIQRGETHSAGNPLSQGRAFDRVIEIARDHARLWPVHVSILHFGAPDKARDLQDRMLHSGLELRGQVDILEVPPSLGVGMGTGSVGLVVSPTDWRIFGD